MHADLPGIQAATDESLAEANTRFFDLLLRDDGDRWHAVEVKFQRSHHRQD